MNEEIYGAVNDDVTIRVGNKHNGDEVIALGFVSGSSTTTVVVDYDTAKKLIVLLVKAL